MTTQHPPAAPVAAEEIAPEGFAGYVVAMVASDYGISSEVAERWLREAFGGPSV